MTSTGFNSTAQGALLTAMASLLLGGCALTVSLGQTTSDGGANASQPDAGATAADASASPDPLADAARVDAPATARDPLPSNATCEAAMSVEPGVTVPDQSTTGVVGTTLPCRSNSSPNIVGAPLWYRVVVPPYRTLLATAVVGAGVLQPSVRIYRSCASTSCLAADTLSPILTMINARWTNGDEVPVEVLVTVASYRAGEPTHFTFAPTLIE